jgi:uncharacterized protein with PIN domain
MAACQGLLQLAPQLFDLLVQANPPQLISRTPSLTSRAETRRVRYPSVSRTFVRSGRREAHLCPVCRTTLSEVARQAHDPAVPDRTELGAREWKNKKLCV